ncbi:MAG: nucleotidyl transferase AbiEii/AbiGii toxin family protein [Bacteroidia bacterium]|nr:nucleotidyl transferase AbiEii/AbiGii toxin family protein [Bacteroidia bacterium]
MQGLTNTTEKLFEALSLLSCLEDYILIGGTALALQINKRLSEDLDFDYYDIYSILKEGKNLKELVLGAAKYSNHIIKSKNILSFILNGNNYKYDTNFKNLKPYYSIDNKGIEKYIKSLLL